MDIIPQIRKKLLSLKKYKYAFLILLLGLLFLLLPSKTNYTAVDSKEETALLPQTDISQQLSQILSQIEGAGKVEVMLTISAGAETIYQTDQDTAAGEGGNTAQVKTVILSTSDKSESGLVKQVISPRYLGAIVVCQGADSPVVRLAIMEAVAKITGLGTNCISVLKMK